MLFLSLGFIMPRQAIPPAFATAAASSLVTQTASPASMTGFCELNSCVKGVASEAAFDGIAPGRECVCVRLSLSGSQQSFNSSTLRNFLLPLVAAARTCLH